MKPLSCDDTICVGIVQQMHAAERSLSEIAHALTAVGYCSKSRILLSASHISNFMHDDLGLAKVPKYDKPYYVGWNHVNTGQAKIAGVWRLKLTVDERHKRGFIADNLLSDDDWTKLIEAGQQWVIQFHKYILHLATYKM